MKIFIQQCYGNVHNKMFAVEFNVTDSNYLALRLRIFKQKFESGHLKYVCGTYFTMSDATMVKTVIDYAKN